jgi:myo-inositol 2-dehydrogenase/D-chiro-inositol 1-dehydrogenase
MADQKIVKLCLVGIGRIGLLHLGNILANYRCKLTALVEPVQTNLLKASQVAPEVPTFSTLKEALAKEGANFDGVVICTPTHLHTDLIKESLDAGKHVMCEKPLGHDAKTIASLYEQAANVKRHLLCCFHRRWDPNFKGVYDAVRSGAVGKVHKIHSTSRDNPVPSLDYLKISGGIVHDCASHDIDMLTWVLGDYPLTVYGLGHAQDPEIKAIDDLDSVELIFNFPNQIIGTVDVSRKAVYGYDQRLEVLGDTGMVQANNHPRTSVVLSQGDFVKHDVGRYSFPTRYPEAYQGELDHFLDLANKPELECALSAKHLHNITKILDAATVAAKEGSVVTIDYS